MAIFWPLYDPSIPLLVGRGLTQGMDPNNGHYKTYSQYSISNLMDMGSLLSDILGTRLVYEWDPYVTFEGFRNKPSIDSSSYTRLILRFPLSCPLPANQR